MFQDFDKEDHYYLLDIVTDSLRSKSKLSEKKREVFATLIDEAKISLEAENQKVEAEKRKHKKS